MMIVSSVVVVDDDVNVSGQLEWDGDGPAGEDQVVRQPQLGMD